MEGLCFDGISGGCSNRSPIVSQIWTVSPPWFIKSLLKECAFFQDVLIYVKWRDINGA